MVGDPNMSLHGWRQLVEWSIDFSCLTKEEQDNMRVIFRDDWENFCRMIVQEYGPFAEGLAKS